MKEVNHRDRQCGLRVNKLGAVIHRVSSEPVLQVSAPDSKLLTRTFQLGVLDSQLILSCSSLSLSVAAPRPVVPARSQSPVPLGRLPAFTHNTPPPRAEVFLC